MIFRSFLIFLFTVSLALGGDVCVATSAFYKNETAFSHILKPRVKDSGTEIVLVGNPCVEKYSTLSLGVPLGVPLIGVQKWLKKNTVIP